MIVRVELWHNSQAQFGIAMYKTGETYLMGAKNEIMEELRRLADNTHVFKLDKTVNGIVINTDERHIMQVHGYGERRGMYCDVY